MMIVKKNCKWCQREYEGKLDDICCGDIECVRIQSMFPKSIIENARAVEASEICRQIHKINRSKYHHWRIYEISDLKPLYCKEFWTQDLKRRVAIKFEMILGERKCFECGKLEINNIGKNGKISKLDTHHVYYNKDLNYGDLKSLIVPLCDSCHGKTNNRIHREYWTQHFIEKLQNTPKFDGTCWITKEEYKIYRKSVSTLVRISTSFY